MARDIDPKCKKCRRAGEKLFLKGDRCLTPKCAMVRKAYAPGAHGKKMKKGLSEYGVQLSVKQRIKRIYGILERQFRKHFEEVKNKKGITGDLLIERLEKRLDNVCYRMGMGSSRANARQLISYGWVAVNGKKMTIPSFEVRAGDVISFSEFKKSKKGYAEIVQVLKNKKDFPGWILFDAKELSGKVVRNPERKESEINVDAQVVVEYYSR